LSKEIILPKFGFTQEESEILEWLKNEGDKVEKGDPIVVVSTDKISMEVEAPETGILSGIKHGIGEIVPVTEIIAYILQPGEVLPELGKKKLETEKDKISLTNSSNKSQNMAEKISEGEYIKRSKPEGKIGATPAARRIARELKVDLFNVQGSGPGGRIQAVDVSLEKAIPEKQDPLDDLPAVLKEIPLIGIRRKIADNMARSVREAPHMTLQIDVQMDAIENARKTGNENVKKRNSRISLTAAIVKAVALAIKTTPIINSQLASEKILVLKDINIGVAAALEEGLIVPVIHKADLLDVSRISITLNDLASRARENQLKPEDLSNGTFTISNLGMLGIDRFTAIINPPQSAILAVGAIKYQLVPDESEDLIFTKKKILTFTLSADHRVMDGAQAANFLVELKNLLQQPEKIFK